MPSTDRPLLTERIFAGALILATGLQIAESLVPRLPLFPWLRLGLSWAILLPFLLQFGVRPTLSLFLARNVLSLTFGGQPPSTFLISSLSGVLAIGLGGGILRAATRRGWLGWVGAGVALAVSFNAIQLVAVTSLLVGHSGNYFQLGPILAWSILSGSLVAWLARSFSKPTLWASLDQTLGTPPATASNQPLPVRIFELCLWTLLTLTPFALPDWRWQTGFAVLLGIDALRRGSKSLRILWHSWPYFAFLAWLHLLDTPGHFLAGTSITHEGLLAFALHASRLAAFLLASQQLVRWIPWTRLAPSSLWARGMGLALPLLPGLFPSATRSARTWWRHRRTPGSPNLLETILRDLAP